MKRVGFIGGVTSQLLTFITPTAKGRHLLTLYLMSDSYLGMDQQFDLSLELSEESAVPRVIKKPAISGGVNDQQARKDEEEEKFWLEFGQ
jgi:hypothetical protein